MYSKIKEAFREELIGKTFVYKSKYGGTVFGTIADIHVKVIVSADDETSRKAKIGLSKISPKIKVEENDFNKIKVDKSWLGINLQVMLISENNNIYDMFKENVFILNQISK